MSGAPIAANTIGNKPAIAGSSLYQACLTLRERLWCVPDFGDAFLASLSENAPTTDGSVDTASNLFTPTSPKASPHSNSRSRNNQSDPVTELWQCFRLGAPLCWLFNKLNPRNELPINPDANPNNANECKKQVAKFIIALNHELSWDSDDIFTVSQLYLNDTNGFVKVVRTISKLLDVFESRGLLMEGASSAGAEELEKPSDDRAWAVRELLNTERKYVQDLEVLQNYARALAVHDILPPDTIHNLFGNLNTLVDVQRRFLICVEENVRRPADDQHFGHVFQTMETDFAVYEPFCSNYALALDIINAEAQNITRLRGLPAAEGCYLEPSYELPTFLIKPVQRICKYPLLLEQLLKKTAPDAPFYQELVDGLRVIRRITDKVNETQRLQENIQLVRDLESRVEDWKGHNIQTFGSLLLSDIFMVSKNDTEREYHVYLFEKILVCCKEVLMTSQTKKNSKSNSIIKQKSQTTPTPPGKKPRTTLQLKGRIFINNVTGAHSGGKMSNSMGGGPPNQQHTLLVRWRGDIDQESFTLRCKNEEQLRHWQTAIVKLIEEVNLRRQHIAAHYSQTGGISPGMFNMAGAGANGRRNTAGSLAQQHSHFPQTPQTESPAFPFTPRTESSQANSYHQNHHLQHQQQRLMDDDQIEGLRDGSEGGNTSGRGTPLGGLGGRYSQPAEHRERQMSISTEISRPRARTEDQDSHTMSQWRSNSPHVHPPLPRNGSGAGPSSSEAQYLIQHQQYQQQYHPTPTLRKASSNRQLKQQRPPARSLASGDSGVSSDAEIQQAEQFEQMSMTGGGGGGGASRLRNDSTSTRGLSSDSVHQQYNRSRSSSNPALFAGLPNGGVPPPPPPLPKGSQTMYSNGNSPVAEQQYQNQPISSSRYAPERQGSGNKDKRFSSSSISTNDSIRSSHSRPGSTAASSPLTLSGSSGGGGGSNQTTKGASSGGYMINNYSGNNSNNNYNNSSAATNSQQQVPLRNVQPQYQHGYTAPTQPPQQSNAIKLVIHHGEDKLVVVVLSNVSLVDLTEKVSKKIRLISGKKGPIETLRIRYIDEDGDRILMHDDEDVQMAFEMSRNIGTDVNLVVL